jgi:hypothetical protein
MQPGDADPVAGPKPGCTLAIALDDPHHLMARNYRRFQHREIALDDVKIGAANAADMDTNQHFVRLEPPGIWNIGESKGISLDRGTCGKNGGFHPSSRRTQATR